MTTPETWALVTGACSGIGLELARGLAGRGYPLVLVSNRAEELESAAETIAEQQGVPVETIVMDLARSEAAWELYEQVTRRGLTIEVLVSNAGFLLFGEMADTDPARAAALLQLHVITPSLLACYFGREMRSRRAGHILIVSSASSWTDFPGLALYGGSKRYLRSFATSLREELHPWAVNVTCLAPGAVATALYDTGEGAAKAAARLGVLKDPTAVARAGLQGMFRRRALVLPGAGAKLMALASTLTPRWLIRVIRMRTGYLPKPES